MYDNMYNIPWKFTNIKEHKVSWFEKLGIPLILAAVSGLTFIAYKYPIGYKRIVIPIIIATSSCFICMLAWVLGTTHSNIRILRYQLENCPEKEISKLSSEIIGLNSNLTFSLWAIVIFVLIVGYLIFLYYLPSILGRRSQPAE